MPIVADVQVYGIKESMKILGDIDKKQRFAAIKEIKTAARPLQDIARQTYPTEAPLRGMAFPGKFQYDTRKVQKGLVVKIGGRARYGAAPIVTLIQQDLGGTLYDLAGYKGNTFARSSRKDDTGRSSSINNGTFVPNLNAKWGKAQRGMWRSIRQIRREGYDAILKALEQVAADANRKLVR